MFCYTLTVNTFATQGEISTCEIASAMVLKIPEDLGANVGGGKITYLPGASLTLTAPTVATSTTSQT